MEDVKDLGCMSECDTCTKAAECKDIRESIEALERGEKVQLRIQGIIEGKAAIAFKILLSEKREGMSVEEFVNGFLTASACTAYQEYADRRQAIEAAGALLDLLRKMKGEP